MAELAKVWENNISDLTIKNYFSKTGFGAIPETEERDLSLKIQQSWENLHSQGHITDCIHLNEFLTVDMLIVADYPTHEDILSSFHEIEQEIDEPEEINGTKYFQAKEKNIYTSV